MFSFLWTAGGAKSSGTLEKRFSLLHIYVKLGFECILSIVIGQAFISYETLGRFSFDCDKIVSRTKSPRAKGSATVFALFILEDLSKWK